MIQINNVEFRKWTDQVMPRTVYIGKLRVTASLSVYNTSPPPKEVIHTKLKRMLWEMVYGDLRNPLDELIERALIDADPIYRPRVEELANQLKTLLASPK